MTKWEWLTDYQNQIHVFYNDGVGKECYYAPNYMFNVFKCDLNATLPSVF